MLAGDVSFQPAVEISAPEQMVIEFINRARSDPQAEAARLGVGLNEGASAPISPTAKQPLAPNGSLQRAAELHARDMLEENYFGHTSLSGTSPSERAMAAGYSGGAGENLALVPADTGDPQRDAQAAHRLLFASAGHRQNMLRDHYREIGVGIEEGDYDYPGFGPLLTVMTTQMFGAGTRALITGVAYTDTVIVDDFYSVGEGIGGVQIEATGATGATYATMTGQSGGYALAVPDGTYSLVVRLQDRAGQFRLGTVTVAGSNTKVDVRADLPLEEVPVFDPLDVNRDGVLTPLDALLVLNAVRRSHQAEPDQAELERFDINESGMVTPLDALLVLNRLRQQAPSGEIQGETAAQAMEPVTLSPGRQLSDSRGSTLVTLVQGLF